MRMKIMMAFLVLLVGCTPVSSEPAPKEKTVKLDVEPIYTYDGFYQEWEFSDKDQAKIDGGYLHVSDSHLVATSEYELPSYPLEGTTTNKYLEKYASEINNFLEDEFKRQLNNKLEIDIREDRLYDYQEKQNENGVEKGVLSYRFDVIGYEEYPRFYNEIEIDRDLLATKNEDDSFDVNILKIKERDGLYGSDWYGVGWYSDYVLKNVLNVYYSDQITKYYSDTVKDINDYIDSTGNYYAYDRNEVCPASWQAGFCMSTGSVMMNIGLSKKGQEYKNSLSDAEMEIFISEFDKIEFEFIANDYSIDEVIEYVNSNELYAFVFSVDPFISKEIYDKYNLDNLGFDTKKNMKNFTDNTLNWMVDDKNKIKQILEDSGIKYGRAYVTFYIGYKLANADDDDEFFSKSASFYTVRLYDGNYEWLTEDIVRREDSENYRQFGEPLSFIWEGNK